MTRFIIILNIEENIQKKIVCLLHIGDAKQRPVKFDLQRTSVEGLDCRDFSRELSEKLCPDTVEEQLPCTPIQEKIMLPVAAVSDSEVLSFSFAFQWKRISH